MAKPMLDFLFDLAKKAGISEDNEDLKKFLTDHVQLNSVQVPDTIAAPALSMMSIDLASNHPTVKGKAKAEALNTVTNKVLAFASEFLSPSDVEELKSETSTYAQLDLLTSKIKSKKPEKDPSQESEWKTKVNTLTDEIMALKNTLKDKDTAITQAQAEAEGKIRDFRIKSAIKEEVFKQNWSETYHENNRMPLFDYHLNSILQSQYKDAKIDIDESGNILFLQKDGTKYVDPTKNEEVTWKTVVSKIMADNNLQKVAQTPTQSANPGTQKSNSVIQPDKPTQPNPSQKAAQNAASQALADFQQASKE